MDFYHAGLIQEAHLVSFLSKQAAAGKCFSGGKLEGLTHHPPGLGRDIVAQLPLQVAVSTSAASWTCRHAGRLWSARQVQPLVFSVS